MKYKVIDFLQNIFPFLITIGLWRMSHPIWNPGGILAIIPIFFFSFIKPKNWFLIFAGLMCICLDYNFETVCWWLAVYCFFYALNGFQNWTDLTNLDYDGILVFLIFLGVGVSGQVFENLTWVNLLNGIWVFVLTSVLYLPTVWIIKKVKHD